MRWLTLLLMFPALAFGQQQVINIGVANQGNGDTLYTWANKDNANFAQLFASPFALSTQYVSCTNGSTGVADTARLAIAFAAGGNITLTSNCTVNAQLTAISQTVFNGNGFTVTPAAAANWAGSAIGSFINAANNASNITVQNTNLPWSGAGGGVHILSFPSGNSHIKVLNNWSTGAGDLVAFVGTTDGIAQGNTCLASLNACYDAWFGATDIKFINNVASMATGATGAAALQFTGFNTAGTATLTTGFTAIGNSVYLATNVQIGINVNGFAGSCTGAKDDQDIVADNRIYEASGIEGPGIRFSGCGSYADVHDNELFADGATSSSYPAIEAQSSWTAVKIHDNFAYGWLAPTTGSDDGVFNNQSPSGTIVSNQCYGTCSSLLVGAVATTTQIAGNSFGTNDFTVTTAQATAGLIGQNTGNAGFNSAMAMLCPNITGGNRCTYAFGQATSTGNSVQEEFSFAGNNNGGNYWAISMAGTGTDFIKWQYFPDALTLGDTGTAVSSAATFGTAGYAIGSLPTCNTGSKGFTAYVTNGQTTPTYLGTVSSTGAVVAPVFCNGSGWVYH